MTVWHIEAPHAVNHVTRLRLRMRLGMAAGDSNHASLLGQHSTPKMPVSHLQRTHTPPL